ncbi:MAG: hypothetical protein OXC05_00085 [Halieaceae bacterium]|nr:hypothetical protein [Halieaceae bacterium]
MSFIYFIHPFIHPLSISTFKIDGCPSNFSGLMGVLYPSSGLMGVLENPSSRKPLFLEKPRKPMGVLYPPSGLMGVLENPSSRKPLFLENLENLWVSFIHPQD